MRPRPARPAPRGYALIMLMLVVSLSAIFLLTALPVYKTELQREREEELIFRGGQYMEAVRLFQSKKGGQMPKTLDELLEEKTIRRLFKDPMTPGGAWDLVLMPQASAQRALGQSDAFETSSDQQPGETSGGDLGAGGVSEVLVASAAAVEEMDNPQVIGVVSPSTEKSIRVLEGGRDRYDKWLFFYGMNPKALPKITYVGKAEKDEGGDKGDAEK